MAVEPAGKFVYVANIKSKKVSIFAIDGTSGALWNAGTAETGDQPTSVAVEASGRSAYVINSVSKSISMYPIEAMTGMLTSKGDPLSTTGDGPIFVTTTATID